MVGWLLDALAFSLGSGQPAEPRSTTEASERFFFRSLAVGIGFMLSIAGALAVWCGEPSVVRNVGACALVLGALMVLSGIPRLVHLWRAAEALRRAEQNEP